MTIRIAGNKTKFLGAKSSTPAATSAASVPKPAGLSFGAAKPATATTSAAATTTTSSLLGSVLDAYTKCKITNLVQSLQRKRQQ